MKVALVGATGPVGQRFVSLLDGHPFFELAELFASGRSAGRTYSEAVNWVLEVPIPEFVKDMKVKSIDEPVESQVVFSALPADVAMDYEALLKSQGKYVFTNASAHRMDDDVPIIVPEVNPDHLKIVSPKGFIVANPNCTTAGLVIPLKAIQDAFGLKSVIVVSMQALSGAGFPGVPSLSIVDNLIPHIKNEEAKVRRESRKILGRLKDRKIEQADFTIDVRCTRVPVRDGHTEVVFVQTAKPASAEEVIEVFENFSGVPQEMNLPTAPANPIVVRRDQFSPQPFFERMNGGGMSVTVGNVREADIMGITFTLVSHNTIRGAAGGSILNAELAFKIGIL